MKKNIFLLLMGLSVFSFSQEVSPKDSLLYKTPDSVNLDLVDEKVLFQDRDLVLIRKIDLNGKDWITFNYGESIPIEISKSGEIKVQNRIVTKDITLTNVPFQETINPNYILDLEALEKHIKKDKKLPSFPSNTELQTAGIEVGAFQMKLLKEIEELSLIVIEQNKRIRSMEKAIKKMKIIMVNKPFR